MCLQFAVYSFVGQAKGKMTTISVEQITTTWLQWAYKLSFTAACCGRIRADFWKVFCIRRQLVGKSVFQARKRIGRLNIYRIKLFMLSAFLSRQIYLQTHMLCTCCNNIRVCYAYLFEFESSHPIQYVLWYVNASILYTNVDVPILCSSCCSIS